MTAATAQRDGRDTATSFAQFDEGRQRKTRTGHPNGMSQRDGAAIYVDFFHVDTEFVGGREPHGGERLVDFNEIEALDVEVRLLRRLKDRVRGLVEQ